MNIETIKNKINFYKGKAVNFRFNGSRNKIEEFSGIIKEVYPSIFIVEKDDDEVIRAFSYSDVLIHKLVIKDKM